VLNPTKIAGQCSRLKCCLTYEDDLYVEMSKGLPKAGKRVETPEGIGRVDDLDVLGGRVRVSFFEKPPMTFAASEVRLVPNEPNFRGPAPARPQAAAAPDSAASDKDDDNDDSPLVAQAKARGEGVETFQGFHIEHSDISVNLRAWLTTFYVTTQFTMLTPFPTWGRSTPPRWPTHSRAITAPVATKPSSSPAPTSTGRKSSACRASRTSAPKDYCDGIVAKFKAVWAEAASVTNRFIRTTDARPCRLGSRPMVAAHGRHGRHLQGRLRRHVLRGLRRMKNRRGTSSKKAA